MTTTQTTETWTNANPALAAKALKCAALAVSEFKLGNEPAADSAAYRAGLLTQRAGFTADQLADECPALVGAGNCWAMAIDGWYDAAEGKAA